VAGVRVARSQDGRDQLARLSVEDHKRVIDVLLEVTVIVALLLIAVGGIVRGIEVEQHLLRSTVLATLSDIHFAQSLGDPVAGTGADRILHPRDGGLACQIFATLRQGSAHQLQQRIGAQGARVVLILVAAGYLVDALLEQASQRVSPLSSAPLRDVLGHRFTHPELRIDLRYPKQSAV
jgi:hypothetical protein